METLPCLSAATAARFRRCGTGCRLQPRPTAASGSHLQFGVVVQPTQGSGGQAWGVGII